MDPASAGDWCTAGLLALLSGEKIETITDERLQTALRYVQALATWNCRFEGARGGMYEQSPLERAREVEAILAGTPLLPEPEHVDIRSDYSPTALCPACNSKPRRARRTARR